jgi:hypothetical protein
VGFWKCHPPAKVNLLPERYPVVAKSLLSEDVLVKVVRAGFRAFFGEGQSIVDFSLNAIANALQGVFVGQVLLQQINFKPLDGIPC